MKQKHRYMATAVAAALVVGMTIPTISAYAEETQSIVEIPHSAYLADNAGTLQLTVNGERTLRVQVEKQTIEGQILYYDTLLEDSGVYQFTLDSCEYNLTADKYDSSFTVCVFDENDPECIYTLTDMLVPDAGFSKDVDTTQYVWHVTSEQSTGDRACVATATTATATSGIWSGSSDVTLQYIPYTRGDVDDNGKVEIKDAFLTLLYSSQKAAGTTPKFTDGSSLLKENIAFSAADADRDAEIAIHDAFLILLYYSKSAVGDTPSWE